MLAELERKAKREKTPLNEVNLPQLWILTPTASSNVLQGFHPLPPTPNWERGIYFLGTSWKTAIVVIHQLPQTPETLWLRLLGKGRVQARAIQELEALPREHRQRESVLKLVRELVALLTKRQARTQDLDREDRELIMTLTQMYEEAMAEVRQEMKEELRQEMKEELRQEIRAVQEREKQAKEEGLQQGEKQATLRSIANLIRVRFGEVDEELAAIVEAIASRPSEEFTPLLLQLSREELLTRFNPEQEQ
ncbi:MAG: hypothetical protein AB4290_12585 [Spirulina sp.]